MPTAKSQLPMSPGLGETLRGIVERIVYRNEDTGYTVCSIRVDGRADDVTLVGTTASIWVGESIKAEGKLARHNQYGFQFQATRIVCDAPVTADGVRKYLASGLIKGVGPVMAQKLVEAFGDATLDVIDKESKRLLQVEGIGEKRREIIKRAWKEQKAVRDIMLYLHAHGVGTSQATRIYNQYGDDAIAVVSKNPYRLCRDIWGIGFKTADKIAMDVGIPRDSEVRARAGLTYVLDRFALEGHCFCERNELVDAAEEILGVPPDVLEPALEAELAEGALTLDADRVYLARLHRAEAGVAAELTRLLSARPGFEPLNPDAAVPWAAKRMTIEFAPAQAHAIAMCLERKVAIITGGPGVGKTTIVRAVLDIFEAKRLAIELAAPTGRAAKRLEETTGRGAMTLHRVLKYTPGSRGFEFGSGNPLAGDVFIVDEVSMIDIELMHALLQALPDGASLILVGDADQLPSVGPGNVLRDLIASGRVACTRLETIFRQSSESWIVRNAHRIHAGEGLALPDSSEPSDFYFIAADEPDDVVDRVVSLVVDRIPKRFKHNPMTDVQVLTPMQRNQLGAENLNAVLQEKLNPDGPSYTRFGRAYRAGDRVMQMRNNYDRDVFNGDIGRIRDIDPEDQAATVDFDGRLVSYAFSELDELQLAYATSIHKSQGSEYPVVVVVLATQHYKLLQRNLLYTAITRGRSLVCLVGSRKAVWMAIQNDESLCRKTYLAERLRE